MTSRRRSGSSAPTSSAPFSAPLSVATSGPLMHKMIPAPLSTSARLPIFAPAISKSVSGMDAVSPAPFSTETSAPSAMNFFTVSGIAAQRVSPGASFRTAIFIRREGLSVKDDEDDEGDPERDHRRPLQHSQKISVVANMNGDILSRRTGEQGFVFGHRHSLQ